MRRFALVVIAVTLLSGSVTQAGSYQKTDGTIIDPIRSHFTGLPHSYNGNQLKPNADLANAELTYADLPYANLTSALLRHANLTHANLTHANLENAILGSADLGNATLTDAILDYAELTFTNLDYADLTGANLHNVNLHKANLTNADLRHATLTHADLTYTNLGGADLGGANLTHAYLTGANLSGATSGGIIGIPYTLPTNWQFTQGYLIGPEANLTNADLRYANLDEANLTNANLRYADLDAADLTNADLSGTDLTYSDLRYADLTFADLDGANLNYANLNYANLTSADLTTANMSNTRSLDTATGSPFYYASTPLPSDFDPVAEGWILAPYCDFTPDAACDLADINQMFEAGNLVTGVGVSEYFTGVRHKLDLIPNDTVDTADISEWLSLAATVHGHDSPYLRGDTDLDRDVDLTDYNAVVNNFDPLGTYGPYLWNDGNSDGDNDVDLTDYNAVASNFQPLGYGAAAVPEPTSLCLLLAGLLLLTRVRL
jgi:uncharacterized protein YjbI with pentapeptide repeats